MLSHKTNRWLLFFFFVSLCLFLCYQFSQIYLKSWDEAVYANNAIEMSKTHNWWVMYTNGRPDFYNTKPPLVIWLQSISISIFGVNEFAIRLPSFISLFLIVIILFRFFQKRFNNLLFSFFTLGILLTSFGFLSFHGFATGDLDAMLCLWVTLCSLIIFDKLVLSAPLQNPKWIYFTGFFFLLAFLTKSTAAFLPIPGLLTSVFVLKKQKELFQNKHVYIVFFILAFIISGYYYMMELKRPGYFNHAWTSEYKRIYENIMPWHSHSFDYYFKTLAVRFSPWFWFLIPSVVLGILSKNNFVKKLTVFSFIYCLSYLLIISIPPVKLEWYDVPLYPFLSVLTAVFFFEIINRLKSAFPKRKFLPTIPFIVFFAIATPAFISIIKKNKHPAFKEPLEREGIALRNCITDTSITSLRILMQVEHSEHYNQLNFYRERFSRERGFRPEIIYSIEKINLSDTILVCQSAKIDSLQNFHIDTIKKINGCLLLRVY